MSVKITQFEAENVKRIKAVQIIPAENGLTLIGGDNNQGKTSVLDSIAWALGGDKFRPAAAQRDGANAPAYLRVVLSNGCVVERKGKNSALTVTDPTGKRAGQQLLNEFVEALALDLPRFMNANDREKADTLLKIIGVGDMLACIDREIKQVYDKRTAIGQIAESKQHYDLVFVAQLPFGAALSPNLSAADFFARLSAWIRAQERLHDYPEVSGYTVTKIQASNAGVITQADANAARYQLQIKLNLEEV